MLAQEILVMTRRSSTEEGTQPGGGDGCSRHRGDRDSGSHSVGRLAIAVPLTRRLRAEANSRRERGGRIPVMA